LNPGNLLKKLFFGLIILFIGNAKGAYILHVPKNHGAARAPLFVVLHGFSSSAGDIEKISRFSEKADRDGFYVLYPEMSNVKDWTKCWRYFLPEEQTREGESSAALLADLRTVLSKNSIDPQQIYLVGMSAGASMASLLVSCHPEIFNGVALHSGTSYGLSSSWDQALLDLKMGPSHYRKINEACHPRDFKGKILIAHGSGDDLVNGRHFDRIIADFLPATLLETQKTNESGEHWGYVQTTYRRDKVIVGESFLIQGLLHVWSGGGNDGLDSDGKKTKLGPDMTENIIQFFLH